jgi:hypothetical protein
MGSVLAKADVTDDEELREALSNKADCRDDRSLWIICCSSQVVLHTWGDRYAKEYNRAETLADKRLKEGHNFVDASTVLVRERGDEHLLIVLVGNKEREDKHRL